MSEVLLKFLSIIVGFVLLLLPVLYYFSDERINSISWLIVMWVLAAMGAFFVGLGFLAKNSAVKRYLALLLNGL